MKKLIKNLLYNIFKNKEKILELEISEACLDNRWKSIYIPNSAQKIKNRNESRENNK